MVSFKRTEVLMSTTELPKPEEENTLLLTACFTQRTAQSLGLWMVYFEIFCSLNVFSRCPKSYFRHINSLGRSDLHCVMYVQSLKGTLLPKGSDLRKIKRYLSRENASYSSHLSCCCQSLPPSAFLLLSTFFPTFPLCLNLRKSLFFLTGRNISSQKCLWVIHNDTQFVFLSLRTSQANFSSFLSIASIHLSFGVLAAY